MLLGIGQLPLVLTPNKPTGATRIFAPQPLDSATVASCQGIPVSNFSQALKQVIPGARLLSGLLHQSTKAFLKNGSRVLAVYSPDATASKASPTAKAICVSSVTKAGSPSNSFGPWGGKRRIISSTDKNSVLAPKASPKANPNKHPEARRISI
jgi:hypothetical protein